MSNLKCFNEDSEEASMPRPLIRQTGDFRIAEIIPNKIKPAVPDISFLVQNPPPKITESKKKPEMGQYSSWKQEHIINYSELGGKSVQPNLNNEKYVEPLKKPEPSKPMPSAGCSNNERDRVRFEPVPAKPANDNNFLKPSLCHKLEISEYEPARNPLSMKQSASANPPMTNQFAQPPIFSQQSIANAYEGSKGQLIMHSTMTAPAMLNQFSQHPTFLHRANNHPTQKNPPLRIGNYVQPPDSETNAELFSINALQAPAQPIKSNREEHLEAIISDIQNRLKSMQVISAQDSPPKKQPEQTPELQQQITQQQKQITQQQQQITQLQQQMTLQQQQIAYLFSVQNKENIPPSVELPCKPVTRASMPQDPPANQQIKIMSNDVQVGEVPLADEAKQNLPYQHKNAPIADEFIEQLMDVLQNYPNAPSGASIQPPNATTQNTNHQQNMFQVSHVQFSDGNRSTTLFATTAAQPKPSQRMNNRDVRRDLNTAQPLTDSNAAFNPLAMKCLPTEKWNNSISPPGPKMFTATINPSGPPPPQQKYGGNMMKPKTTDMTIGSMDYMRKYGLCEDRRLFTDND